MNLALRETEAKHWQVQGQPELRTDTLTSANIGTNQNSKTSWARAQVMEGGAQDFLSRTENMRTVWAIYIGDNDSKQIKTVDDVAQVSSVAPALERPGFNHHHHNTEIGR